MEYGLKIDKEGIERIPIFTGTKESAKELELIQKEKLKNRLYGEGQLLIDLAEFGKYTQKNKEEMNHEKLQEFVHKAEEMILAKLEALK